MQFFFFFFVMGKMVLWLGRKFRLRLRLKAQTRTKTGFLYCMLWSGTFVLNVMEQSFCLVPVLMVGVNQINQM